MNYYVHRNSDQLEHAVREKGGERANHKYVARVNVGGRFRYFYTPEELSIYKSGKKVTRVKPIKKDSLGDKKSSNKSSAIKVVRKDGKSQTVKPIKKSRSPRDSKENGRLIVESLFSKKRKITSVKPISSKPNNTSQQKSTNPNNEITNPFLRDMLGFTAMEKSVAAEKAKATTVKPISATKRKTNKKSTSKRRRKTSTKRKGTLKIIRNGE